MTVGVIDTLRERGIGPSELWCDTSYGSGHNGWEAERRGTELVSPVGGRAPGEADEDDGLVRLTAADFDIDVTARRAAVCPAGHEAVSEYEDEEAPERVEMHFAREVCESCKLRSRCPVRWRRRPELGGEWSPSGAYVLSADLARVNIGRRRRAESDGQWRKRYGLRAGIEGTNSELKRRHGLGRLRYVEERGSGSQSTSRPWPVTSSEWSGHGWTRCWSGRLPWRPLPPMHEATGAVASPLMPTRTGYGAPQLPHRPQHKPRPEQTNPSRLTALTPQNQPERPLLRGNQS